MLKFLSIGSGSSGNCYFLQTANDAILIDAGVGIRNIKKHLYNYGLSLDRVHHILITHDHADHIKSVGVISAEYNIPVYTSVDVHQGIMRNYCVPKKIPSENCKTIKVGQHFAIGDFSITTFPVPHDSCGNIGYRIEAEGIVFCLMTDVGHVTEEMQQHISDANYLVLEANYDEEMLRTGPYPQHLKERIASGSGHLSNKACGEAQQTMLHPPCDTYGSAISAKRTTTPSWHRRQWNRYSHPTASFGKGLPRGCSQAKNSVRAL